MKLVKSMRCGPVQLVSQHMWRCRVAHTVDAANLYRGDVMLKRWQLAFKWPLNCLSAKTSGPKRIAFRWELHELDGLNQKILGDAGS